MTLTTATSTSAASADSVLFDDYLSHCTASSPPQQQQQQQQQGVRPQHVRQQDECASTSASASASSNTTTALPVEVQLAQAQSNIDQLVDVVHAMRLELDTVHAHLRTETQSSDRFAAENLRLQSELASMQENYAKTKTMFKKVRRAASYLKEDALNSDRECVELRLEVEALKRERDEYRERAMAAAGAEGGSAQEEVAVSEGAEEEGGDASYETGSYSVALKGEEEGPAREAREASKVKRRISLDLSGASLITADTFSLGSFDYDAELASLGSGGGTSCPPSSLLNYGKNAPKVTPSAGTGSVVSARSVASIPVDLAGDKVGLIGEENNTPIPLSEVALVESTSRSA